MPLYQVQQPPRESVINQIGALIQGIQQGQELARKRQIEAQMLPLQKALLEAQAGYYNQRGEGQTSGADMINLLKLKRLESLMQGGTESPVDKFLFPSGVTVNVGPADAQNQALGFAAQGKPGTAQPPTPSKSTPSISSLMPVISAMTGGSAPIAQRAAKFFEIAKQQGKEGQYTESGMTLKEKQPVPVAEMGDINALVDALANIQYIEDQGLEHLSGKEQFIRNTGLGKYSKKVYEMAGGDKGSNASKGFMNIRNATLKAQGGKALTPMEIKTTLEAMPEPAVFDENFKNQWAGYKKMVRARLESAKKVYEDLGYKIPDTDKAIQNYYNTVAGKKQEQSPLSNPSIKLPDWNPPQIIQGLPSLRYVPELDVWAYKATDGNWWGYKKDGTSGIIRLPKGK